MYYLCFRIKRIPDLTLARYSMYDISGIDDLKKKHGVFLRQLYRLGLESQVFFHLLYRYDDSPDLRKGERLEIIFYATAELADSLQRVRELVTTSVLSDFYDFYSYEAARVMPFPFETEDADKYVFCDNLYGLQTYYPISPRLSKKERALLLSHDEEYLLEIEPKTNAVTGVNHGEMDMSELRTGSLMFHKKYRHAAFLTKKHTAVRAENPLRPKEEYPPLLYTILPLEPCEDGRVYNVLKLMEGYNAPAAVRIDLFPEDAAEKVAASIHLDETRQRINLREFGRDSTSENVLRTWESYLRDIKRFPLFNANITAFADQPDIAVMLADSVGAEAIESGTYCVEPINARLGHELSIYEFDSGIIPMPHDSGNYAAPFLSLYTLREIRPMFCFPILNPGEDIEMRKETDPVFADEGILLGNTFNGYDVVLPIDLLQKHAFIAGVPGSGKTNTMQYLISQLWKRDIPFLVLEPAKKEYRALAYSEDMKDLLVFSPNVATRFHLHINPFEFPVGMTLSEHINKLHDVFLGAFFLPLPAPKVLDDCMLQIYLDKGWNEYSVNDGTRKYPTMQDLHDSFAAAISTLHYESDIQGNLRSILEVRIGSLMSREVGLVYNVSRSVIKPEDWLKIPAVIELESLGKGPANFMSLLITTLIREALEVQAAAGVRNVSSDHRLKHVIFYEEAHNLIGPEKENLSDESVNPKVSATAFLVDMLAEVRALHEGIVIADQLPSVMAPEVLKNTSLKIGHKITAVDDRQILGSTMSANSSQMEEQGTFSPGEALVSYENIRKPFKMQIKMAEHETGTSPDDNTLFDLISKGKYFSGVMKISAELAGERIINDFEPCLETLKNILNRLNALAQEHKNYLTTVEGMKNTEGLDPAQTKNYQDEAASGIEKRFANDINDLLLLMKRVCLLTDKNLMTVYTYGEFNFHVKKKLLEYYLNITEMYRDFRFKKACDAVYNAMMKYLEIMYKLMMEMNCECLNYSKIHKTPEEYREIESELNKMTDRLLGFIRK